VNVPRSIGAVVSAGKATLVELDTVYGLGDLYDLIEVIVVDAHNQAVVSRRE
jgi:hypothetical protein